MSSTSEFKWAEAHFKKSSRSNGSGGGNCIEIAVDGSDAAIRDSKLPTTGIFPVLEVSREELRAFVLYSRSNRL